MLMSEGLKDLQFIFMCLKYLKLKVNLPMLVLIDNIGAIEMLDLKTNKCRTKHVNTRYHWIREFIDDNIVAIKYVKSENNVSDICMKNLPSKLFEKHSNKLVSNVGLFTRCKTRQMGKAETWEDTDWAREGRLRNLESALSIEFLMNISSILTYGKCGASLKNER